MSTAIPPSDSAMTNVTSDLMLVTRLVPMDARLGLGRKLEGHTIIEGKKMAEEEFDGIVWLADENIQFGEVLSPSLDSLYPPSISILPIDNHQYCVSPPSEGPYLLSHLLSIHQVDHVKASTLDPGLLVFHYLIDWTFVGFILST